MNFCNIQKQYRIMFCLLMAASVLTLAAAVLTVELCSSPLDSVSSFFEMDILYQCKEILKIQKLRRLASYAGFYSFTTLVTYAYTSNTTRAGISRADQYYASYPSGTELLTDTAKLYKAALGNCFEIDDWGPIEFSIMAKHFDRQGKPPYAYHAQYMSHLLSQGQLDGSG